MDSLMLLVRSWGISASACAPAVARRRGLRVRGSSCQLFGQPRGEPGCPEAGAGGQVGGGGEFWTCIALRAPAEPLMLWAAGSVHGRHRLRQRAQVPGIW
jgi:hypothetical protein